MIAIPFFMEILQEWGNLKLRFIAFNVNTKKKIVTISFFVVNVADLHTIVLQNAKKKHWDEHKKVCVKFKKKKKKRKVLTTFEN
jgi:hypothetical protein